jgi:hypothetical protein
MSGPTKFSLKNVRTKLISKSDLSTHTNQLLAGNYGDPNLDKLMDEFLNERRQNGDTLRVLVKRIYYLGILEGSRRFVGDPRVRYVKK